MLFNSPIFPVFFAAVWLLYRVLPPSARKLLLLGASYLFYAWWDWRFLSLIIASTLVDWGCGLAMGGRTTGRRRFLALSVIVNLAILGTFKYLDFFLGEANRVLDLLGVNAAYPMMELILPVGLSFYTFQSMSYTIDVYRGRVEPTRSLPDFALFVAFFPQLVAGPIERSERLMPQLRNLQRATRTQLAEGAHLILWGYFKKVFVADNLGVIVGRAFEGSSEPSGFLVLVAAYAFTWQIYCDFSGYTDIARGIAKLLGVELSINFRLPFFATSPRELWRRWHISLSQWLRDYLYISLGGNRRGSLRTQFNLAATMILGGLWHGASWTFIVWGAYHGFALAIQRALPRVRLGRVGRVAAIIATFHFTTLGFLIFRAHDMGQVGRMLSRVVTDFAPVYGDRTLFSQLMVLVAFPLVVEVVQYARGDDLELLTRLPRPVQGVLSVAMIVAIVVLGASYGQRFIYFQF